MNTTRIFTGGLMAAVPLIFTIGFTGLQMVFDYPDILRHPAGEVLTRFAEGGADLRAYWYLMFIAGILLVPASISWAVMNFRESPSASALAGGFGIAAGLVQAMGLMRWTALVPALAASYTAPGATELDKALAAQSFDVANAYLGMGVGEHMGYLFMALFTLAVAATIAKQQKTMAVTGAVLALGIALGVLETFGIEGVSTINALAFTGWSVWALVLGVMTMWRGRKAEAVFVALPA